MWVIERRYRGQNEISIEMHRWTRLCAPTNITTFSLPKRLSLSLSLSCLLFVFSLTRTHREALYSGKENRCFICRGAAAKQQNQLQNMLFSNSDSSQGGKCKTFRQISRDRKSSRAPISYSLLYFVFFFFPAKCVLCLCWLRVEWRLSFLKILEKIEVLKGTCILMWDQVVVV